MINISIIRRDRYQELPSKNCKTIRLHPRRGKSPRETHRQDKAHKNHLYEVWVLLAVTGFEICA